MNLIRKANDRYLLSLTAIELVGINNALNEVCNGIDIDDAEFQTRLALTRAELASILKQAGESLNSEASSDMEFTSAWSDGGSVQVRAISVFGDPVDMGSEEARTFAALITKCAIEADET
jgi:hypothetical protein